MKRLFASEFLFQVFALLLSLIVVHTLYVAIVWPGAEAELAAQAARIASGDTTAKPQSLLVILKDYEQESTVILFFWCLAIMGYKGMQLRREHALFDEPLLRVPAGTSILPEDARDFLRPIEALGAGFRECLLPRTLVTGLQRFAVTHSIQDAYGAIREGCLTEGDRLDSELSLVRYIAWAIPAIGFIGTVRGIGMALSEAYRAVEGDIAGVTDALGVAFNSTLVALLLSIVLMFVVHQLQLQQERLVLRTQSFCDGSLMPHLKVSRELGA
ncbi:MAG: MotA/TolQ/ExbB proton channel family protein [Gammaproteobacteria bacterium]